MKKIPFPQANSLERSYRIFMSLNEQGLSKFELIKQEQLAEREGAYYLDSLYFLGFVDKFNTKYFLSNLGIELQKNCGHDGRKAFARAVLYKDFFSDVYKAKGSFSNELMFREYIAQKLENNYQLGPNTAKRRTSTVMAWFHWIEDNIKEEAK